MALPDARHRMHHGFSLTELLVVVGIIAVMAAVALPNIAGWFRSYKLKAAAQRVASDIAAARLKAIMKNVNFGVIFVVTANNRYRWIIEDDQDPSNGITSERVAASTLITDPNQAGPEQTLPAGIEFGTSSTCSGMSAPTGPALRFRRLGDWCNPTGSAEPCPLVTGIGQDFVANSAGTGAMLCLIEVDSSANRKITITTGGRLKVE